MDSCWSTPAAQQARVTLGVALSMAAQGCVLGYSSALLPALAAAPALRVSPQAAAWLASSLGPTGAVGQLLASVLMEACGRRLTFQLAAAPGACGWLLLSRARGYPALLAGRLLTGLGAGLAVGLGAVILGEYTSPRNRGMCLNLKMASINIGSTIVHFVGNYADWRTVALWALVPYGLSFLISCTWPESPAWLASRRRYERCREDFYSLRGKSDSSVWEVEELIAAQKERLSTILTNETFRDKTVNVLKKFIQKDFLKPVLVSFISLVLLEASGRHFFAGFASQIMTEITGSDAQQHRTVLLLDLVISGSSLASAALVRAMPRRTLLFSSGISSLLALTAACVCLYLLSVGVLPRLYQWVPISLLVVYFILVNLGCTPIPLALQGELFPTHHRSVGVGVSVLWLMSLLSGVLHVAPFLLASLGASGSFAVFGVLMALALAALFVTLPETKDRTLQEIEDYFQNGRFGGTRLPQEDHHGHRDSLI